MKLLKAVIAVLVIAFVGKAIQEGVGLIRESGFSLRQMDFRWLVVAGACYAAGMYPVALNWYWLLKAFGTNVTAGTTIRAHYISQLGKYVPGKAVVVAMRMGILHRFNIRPMTMFSSIVADVLAMLSVGAVIAAVIVAVLYRSRIEIATSAACFAALATMPLIPPVLRFGLGIVHRIKFKKSNAHSTKEMPDLSRTLTWRATLPGWLSIFPGWFLLGLSVFATIKAMNVEASAEMGFRDVIWLTATYAISVSVGFMSMLPGGVGAREVVMKEMLEPSYGELVATIAPMLHRMVLIATELIVAPLCFLYERMKSQDS